MNLFARSVKVILENQDASGAYVASPNFPTYHYSWFRDGAFIAYAMDMVGEIESSQRFHSWAARMIVERKDLVSRALSRHRAGLELTSSDHLHTRYAVDGSESEEGWPNHQLDGFGTWLWALGEHQRAILAPVDGACLAGAGLAADYIADLWDLPCYDCWEEFPDKVHTYTLASIRAGLTAHGELAGSDHSSVIGDIDSYIWERARMNGHFVKHAGSHAVDASLLGLAVPYRVTSLDTPELVATVGQIEATLIDDVGVHRYPTDTYYGGGEWVLLTCWLAWFRALTGDVNGARRALTWVENQTDPNGDLPEQIPNNLLEPDCYQPWVTRWGRIASPLLWSHAMYIIAKLATGDQDG